MVQYLFKTIICSSVKLKKSHNIPLTLPCMSCYLMQLLSSWKQLVGIVNYICQNLKSILCLLPNWWTPSHYIFICQQNNVFDQPHLLLQASRVQMPSARHAPMPHTFTLTCSGFLLRVDNYYEPHNFC